jgi:histidinol-phosphate aminotransferase
VFQRLLRAGVIVRPVAGYGLPEYLRVSIGTEAENRRFLEALGTVIGAVPGVPRRQPGSAR